ncbi:MAG: Do family serine endopeptidase [Opitutaceae bacterium]
MNASRFFRFVLIPLAVSGGLLAASAKKTPNPAIPSAQKPSVRVDVSPVGEGVKSGPVVSYADVLEPAQKAVVSVYSTKIIKERFTINPFFRQFFGNVPDQERESRQEGLGSGVIVTADGYVLTNNHVVEGADELKITLADDRDFIAKVIGRDPKTDVALLKIDGTGLPTVTLADSDQLRVGDIVFAVGNPLGVGQTVTMGIISAKGRSKLGLLDSVSGFEDFIQTDAAINMGNSGGALIDARGRLIGINSAIISPSRGNIGIGFAIPINLAAFIMNSLAEYGSVARGTLGARGDTVTADVAEQLGLPKTTRGVIVTEIDPDSPAEAAGLERADVILAINMHPIRSGEELRVVLSQIAPEAPVAIKVMRDGSERVIKATLGNVIESPNQLLDGVDVAPLTAEARRRLGIRDQRITGLLITGVAKESPFRDQLAPNMIILELNRSPVPDLSGAREKLVAGRNLLAIFDGRSVRYVVVSVTK